MPGSRVLLAADDSSLARAVQGHLHKTLGLDAYICNFEQINQHLSPDADGILLVAATNETHDTLVRQLIQEICLRQLPPAVMIVDGNEPLRSPLEELDIYVIRRLRWPNDADSLTKLVRERLREGVVFPGTGEESVEEVLRRRLLALTPSLLPLVERVALAAKHDVTVLLNGETGVGKTYLARLIHEHSPRKSHRFMAVPCGALSNNLVESEFFGHAKGAFTSADRTKVGKFEAVGHGTLLLDEIDTLGLEQQAALLRVIETGEFEPVGSNETQTSHARLIVAANVDLEKAVANGTFRADLYFRLNVMCFHLPPLRERIEDISPLSRGMAAKFNRKFGKDLFDISPGAMSALEIFSWPGNLRQLENVVQHAVLMSSGEDLLVEHLPPEVKKQMEPVDDDDDDDEGISIETLQRQKDLIERNMIQRALISNGYSRTRTADSLGISRVTLYKKMKKYGLMEMSK